MTPTMIPLAEQREWRHYALVDPRIDDNLLRVRYIGRTVQELRARLSSHLREATRGNKNHRCDGIRRMIREGTQPVIIDLGSGDEREEARLILTYRAAGARLWNGTDGGQGCVNPTEEIRKNLSETQKRNWGNPIIRERRVAAIKAALSSEEARKRKIDAANRSCSRPEVKANRERARREMLDRPEFRLALSRTAKASWADPEQRAIRVQSLSAAVRSQAYKEKMSLPQKESWANPAIRARRSQAVREWWANRKSVNARPPRALANSVGAEILADG